VQLNEVEKKVLHDEKESSVKLTIQGTNPENSVLIANI